VIKGSETGFFKRRKAISWNIESFKIAKKL
jgi:hypothetical protein